MKIILTLTLILTFCLCSNVSQAQCAVGETTVVFAATGAIQTFTVPAGVTSVTVTAVGADGGRGDGTTGGSGATVSGTFTVTPGDVLDIAVGNAGGDGPTDTGAGGGGSGIRDNADAVMLAAGAGGGGGGLGNGSGGLTGASGSNAAGVGVTGGGDGSPGGGGGGLTGSAGGNGITGLGDSADGGSVGFQVSGGSGIYGGGAGGAGLGGGGGGGGGDGNADAGGGGGGGGHTGGAGNPSLRGGGQGGGSFIAGVVTGSSATAGAAGASGGANGSVTICYLAPLPVELMTFTANARGEMVVLNWETAAEINNHGFNIEHSMNARDWQVLDFVAGKGIAGERTLYEYTDRQPSATSINYYRLNQLDMDGKESFSPIASVSLDGSYALEITEINPNPIDGNSMTLSWNGIVNQEATLKVVDVSGKLVFSQILNGLNGVNTQTIQFNTLLSSGIYFAEIHQDEQTAIKKIVVQ